ncbi:MAG: glutamine-hydrolyzing GMP synthase [Chloroflexi bacterium]|nr:glutamine-hydrolyzing GMP synthase [Chloroflexota bacterium]
MARTARQENAPASGGSERPDDQPARPETVVVLDFGSQYSMLIARRVRECHVYCELLPHDAPREEIERLQPRAFILSGGPASVYDDDAPQAPDYVFESGVPVLGICYGMQLLAHQLGGKVAKGAAHEYGHAVIERADGAGIADALFEGLPDSLPVWMSHGDRIATLPPGFRSLAYTDNSPIAVMGNDNGMIGLQFHPEVVHTPQGKEILRNFLFNICHCLGDWTPGNFVAEQIALIEIYLPAQLSDEDTAELVASKVAELELTTKSQLGQLMKAVMAEHRGEVDGKTVQRLAAELLD